MLIFLLDSAATNSGQDRTPALKELAVWSERERMRSSGVRELSVSFSQQHLTCQRMLKDCRRARDHKDNAPSFGSPSSLVAVSWDLWVVLPALLWL